jgi:hypothetical protein
MPRYTISLAPKKVSPSSLSLEREDPMKWEENYSHDEKNYLSSVPVEYGKIKVGDILYQCSTGVLGKVLEKKDGLVKINLYNVDPFVEKKITLNSSIFDIDDKNSLKYTYRWVKAIQKNSTEGMTMGGRKRFTRKSGTKQSRIRRKSRLYKIPATANIPSFRARMYETI